MRKNTLLRLAVLLVLATAVVLGFIFLPVQGYIHDALEWVRELGPWGPIVLAAVYVVACVLFVPGTLLTLAAGFLFGVVVGTITVSVGSVAGASAAFFVGRFLARGWVESWVAKNPKFRAIDHAVGEQGFKIVLLTRLSPVFPFIFLNYAFGLTRVRFRDYLLASWIGMLPGTVMYIYIGSLFQEFTDLSAQRERTLGEQLFFYGGLVVTVIVAVYITRVARRALDRAIAETTVEPEAVSASPKDAP
jgi:uncharacterized membrane protein YdjX (TVP38/TMEM64 family)